MQIILTLENLGIIDIPVNYNYYIQSAIFELLAGQDAEYAELLHNTAYGGKAKYKFFTFGNLNGTSHYYEKKLYFEGNISLEIRSISDEFIHVFTDAVLNNGQMRIGKHTLEVERIEVCDYQIMDTAIPIRTVTPIVAKRITEDKKTIYFSPQDVFFLKRVREDFEHKYTACFGERPQSSIDILPIGESKKVVTRYKDFWITAYHGKFQLCGEPHYLQFLYDVGIGAKTSQGFGMFEMLN